MPKKKTKSKLEITVLRKLDCGTLFADQMFPITLNISFFGTAIYYYLLKVIGSRNLFYCTIYWPDIL